MPGDGLHITIELHRATAADDPHAFRGGEQTYHLRTPGGALEAASLDWSPGFMEQLAKVRLPGRDPALVQQIGLTLRRFLKPTGWIDTEDDVRDALRAGRQVHIGLRASAAELYALPWELLTLGRTGQHLGELAGVSIHYEWPETETEPAWAQPTPPGGRVLLAWSTAAGWVPAAAHQEAIQAACTAGHQDFLPHRDVLANAGLGQLAEALEQGKAAGEPVTVLHLLAHGAPAGSTYGIALDGPGGDASVVTAAELRRVLAPHADTVRLVVLAACDAGNAGALGNHLGSLAQGLHQAGIEAVVAPRFPYSVPGSVVFAETFYQRLLVEPASVEQALCAARQALAREPEHLDWAAIQLFSRAADGGDTRPWTLAPYRGLLPFRREHNRFFFGRQAEVDELGDDLARLWDSDLPRFLVVAGASGTGKSSVVMAGFVPKLMALEAPRWRWTRARPGAQPIGALATAIEAVVGAAVDPSAEGIEAAIRTWRADGAAERLLVVIDQFEELFTHVADADARTAYVRLLWHLAGQADLSLAIVPTLRVDFIGRCGEIIVVPERGLRLDRIAYDEAHRVFVAQMGADQLRAAIERPAHLVGLELEPGLTQRIVDEVQGEPGALPLLQYCLKLLWEQRQGTSLLQSAYDRLGGVGGALQRHADEIVQQATALQRDQTRRLLVRLVGTTEEGAQDTRRRVPIPKLRPPEQAAATAFDAVVDGLVQARLLVRDEGATDAAPTTIEVAHEALIRRWDLLKSWISEDREKLGQLEKLEDWATEWRHHGTLLDDTRLGYAVEVSGRYPGDLSGDALALIRDSQAAAEARVRAEHDRRVELEALLESAQRERARAEAEESRAQSAATRAQRLALAAGLAFLVAAGLGVWAWQLQGAATRSAAQAAEQRDRAQDTLRMVAEQRAEGDPTIQALLLQEVEDPRTAPGWVASTLAVLAVPVAQHVLEGPAYRVSEAVWAPDGRSLSAVSDDGGVHHWALGTGGGGSVLVQHGEWLGHLGATPDGRLLAAGAQDGVVWVWAAADPGKAWSLEAHQGRVTDLAWSGDGAWLATGGQDGRVRVWAEGSSAPIRDLDAGAPIVGLAWSQGSVVAGLEDGRVLAWPPSEDRPRVLTTHAGAVNALAVRGVRVVSGGDDATVRVADLGQEGVQVLTVEAPAARRGIIALALGGDGRIVAATRAHEVLSWGPALDLAEAPAPQVLGAHGSWVWSLDVSPDGAWVLSGGADGLAKLWALRPGDADQVLRGHAADVRHVGFSPDGARLLTTDDRGGVRVWATAPAFAPRAARHPANVSGLAPLPPPHTGLLSDLEGKLVRLGPDGATESLGHHGPWINGLSVTPDGRLAATAGADGTARVWNLADGSHTVLRGHRDPLLGVALSPDGARVATASVDWQVRIWSASGTTQSVLEGHEGWVHAVAWSTDGATLASAGADGVVRLWTAAGDPVAAWETGLGRIETLAFNQDGSRVVFGTVTGEVAWIPVDGSAPPQVVGIHEGIARRVLFHPSQQAVLSAGDDGRVVLWPLDQRLPDATLVHGTEPLTALSLASDGRSLMSADRAGHLRQVRTDALLTELVDHLDAATHTCLAPEHRIAFLGETEDLARAGTQACRDAPAPSTPSGQGR